MKTSDSKLAQKWACDTRTIRRWRKDGAPLASVKEMNVWLAGRKSLPPGTTAILASRSARVLSAAASAVDSETSGAASALRRLETAERACYRMLQSALKSGSPPAIKASRENWLAVGNQLRQYDRQIERDQRDAGELIPRTEVEKHVGHFAYWLRLAARQAASTMLDQVTDYPDKVAAFNAVTGQLWDNILSALSVYSSKPCAAQLPAWWLKAACGSLDDAFTATEATVTSRRGALEQIFAGLVRENAQQRLARLTGLATATAVIHPHHSTAPASFGRA